MIVGTKAESGRQASVFRCDCMHTHPCQPLHTWGAQLLGCIAGVLQHAMTQQGDEEGRHLSLSSPDSVLVARVAAAHG
jgi:hypothetical protein